MYYLKASAHFDSAHFLWGYNGKCANIHGHRWVAEVKIKGEKLVSEGEKRGMLIDFGDLKAALKKIADSLDHALIWEKDSMKPETVKALEAENFRLICVDFRPTAENFAKYFFDKMSAEGIEPDSVTIYETPDNCAVYEVEK